MTAKDDDIQEDVKDNESEGAPSSTPTGAVDSKGVPLENRISEITRKLNRLTGDLDSKLDQVLNSVRQKPDAETNTTHDYIDEDDTSIDSKINKRLAEQRQLQLQDKHFQDFEKLKRENPELDKNSEEYDPDLYKLANDFYNKRGMYLEDNGAFEAVEYAFFKTGKGKKKLEQEILKDEKRRSRTLSEGTGQGNKRKSSGSSVEEELEIASKHMRINPKYYKKAKQSLGEI